MLSRFALTLVLIIAPTMGGCASLGARAAAPDEQGFVGPMPDFGEHAPGPSVRVHIESPYAIGIVRLSEDNEVVERCAAPCDRELSLAGRYRLDGNDVRSSWPFTLEGSPRESVVLRVSPSLRATYTNAKTVGTASMVVGGVGFGLAVAGGIAAVSQPGIANGEPGASCDGCEAVAVVGAALMVVGIGLGTYSLVRQISNMSSSVDQEEQVPVDARPMAQWRSPDPALGALPRAAQLTVLTGHF